MWNELTFLWNELTILWNDLTIDWNDLTWNDLTMERNDRKSKNACFVKSYVTLWAQTRKRFPIFSSVFKVFLISTNPPGLGVSMLKIWIFLFYSVFSIELAGNNTGTTTFLLKAEKWYLNVLLFLLCQPNAKEVIEFSSNTVKKFVGKHFTLQKQTIHICIATKIIFFRSL